MKSNISLIAGLVILAWASPVGATTITFSSGHHTWTSSEPYCDEVFLENDASLDFLSGSIGKLSTLDDSRANLDGGTMTNLWATDNSVVNYYAGELDWIDAGGSSTVYLYAYDVSYDSTGGINGDGLVQGYFYKDDSQFRFSCWNSGTYSHINIVPDPATANSNSKIEDGIEYYVQTDKAVYILGEEVQMLYRVTNLRDEEVTFYPLPSPEWNFWVQRDGNDIWRAINGWWGIIVKLILEPGESKEFPEYEPFMIWDMRDRDGNLVSPGQYTVIGGLYAGSGLYDYTKVGVSITIIPEPVDAEIDITPDTLNLASKGKWINCRIWLPEDYNVADVNSETMLLEDEIPPDRVVLYGRLAMVKFSRPAVQQLLSDLQTPAEVELLVSGRLTDGTPFEGIDTIRVIDKGSRKRAGLDVVMFRKGG